MTAAAPNFERPYYIVLINYISTIPRPFTDNRTCMQGKIVENQPERWKRRSSAIHVPGIKIVYNDHTRLHKCSRYKYDVISHRKRMTDDSTIYLCTSYFVWCTFYLTINWGTSSTYIVLRLSCVGTLDVLNCIAGPLKLNQGRLKPIKLDWLLHLVISCNNMPDNNTIWVRITLRKVECRY